MVGSTRIGSGAAGRLGGLGGVGATGAGIATSAAAAPAPIHAPALAHIRYASTWPRGWMAAAVPQHVRDFNAQISKAQMALEFVGTWKAQLHTLSQTTSHQRKMPSTGGQTRAHQALVAVQRQWLQRWSATGGSLDAALQWSPVQRARKVFALTGWTPETLLATHPNDRELVSFCLMGIDGAHGAWLADPQRSATASQYQLAAALAPLQIQLQVLPGALHCSVDEARWPLVTERFMVKGNGQRFPAGQWVTPLLHTVGDAVQPDTWRVEAPEEQDALLATLAEVQPRVAQLHQQLQQFCDDAGRTLLSGDAQRLQQVQDFAAAFAAAGQAPAYDWVLAVVPAVRAISRRRVARLLRRGGRVE